MMPTAQPDESKTIVKCSTCGAVLAELTDRELAWGAGRIVQEALAHSEATGHPDAITVRQGRITED